MPRSRFPGHSCRRHFPVTVTARRPKGINESAHYVSIAFDSGGVTTGPITVPFLIALNVGVVAVLSGRSGVSQGFGLVALASVGPVIAVMLLGVLSS